MRFQRTAIFRRAGTLYEVSISWDSGMATVVVNGAVVFNKTVTEAQAMAYLSTQRSGATLLTAKDKP